MSREQSKKFNFFFLPLLFDTCSLLFGIANCSLLIALNPNQYTSKSKIFNVVYNFYKLTGNK